MKQRAAVIMIRDNRILLMRRVKKDREYYTFPGGKIEDGETPEKAAIRELSEETTISGKTIKLAYRHSYDDGSEHFFYLCEYISGEPKLDPNSPEAQKMQDGKQEYEPLWFALSNLRGLLLYPLEIKDWLIEDLKNNFTDIPKFQSLKVSEIREEM